MTSSTLGAGWAQRSIEDLGLNVRCFNALANAGVKTIGGLVTMKPRDIVRTKNMGTRSLDHIEERLAVHGLKLGLLEAVVVEVRALADAAPDMFALLEQMHESFTCDSETCSDCGVDNMAVIDGEATHEEACWVSQIEEVLEKAKPGWKKNKGVAHEVNSTDQEETETSATAEEPSPQGASAPLDDAPSSSTSSSEVRHA